MRIGQDILAELQQRLDIEEVVGDYVSLKRKGRNLWACCPFHDEKSPSFSVAPDKGIYKCFGCGKAGDAINFVMEVESLSFMDAVKQLAQKYGLELPEEEADPQDLQEHQEKESLYIVLKFATEYFQDILKNHPEGKSIGYSYLRERGFSDAIIQKFELGYSTEAWDGLLKAATEKGYSIDLLEKAGLIILKEEKKYDRFRGRVIFPIHHPSGKPIAFGARMLGSDKKQPKYLNSPETPVYHKSNVLYGMHLAKRPIRQQDNCYLVEGYTDVISLHLCGIENVVASSGTSLTVEQIRLIGRYSKHITVLYDGDPAGLRASLRGIDLILEGGLQARVVVFPDGEDPDSYSRKLGATAFAAYLQQEATDFVVFKTQLLLKEAGKDPLRRTEVAREVVSSIALLQDPMAQAVYIKECSQLLNIDEPVLTAELQKVTRRKASQQQQQQQSFLPYPDAPPPDYYDAQPEPATAAKPQSVTTHFDSLALQELEGIRLLLRYGFKSLSENLLMQQYLLQEVADLEFKTPVYRQILELYRQQLEQGRILDEQFLLQQESAEIRQVVAELSMSRYELSAAWQERHHIYTTTEEDHLDKTALQYVLRHKFRFVRALIHENQQQLLHTSSEEGVTQILLVHQELKKAEMELAALLGNVIAG
ncbi:DNA primase [Cesiribacter andamanensis]|uniref:DNA primase n=1 Tax=Cesiribacter andamanensis AMV16 TaxID=1279009 RepID=M7N150_9BACT|nr:DNA primase [Cesiribacter andamanensis]EMR00941.1 DNA primase [Cesiribacter andamanensis AMV16]